MANFVAILSSDKSKVNSVYVDRQKSGEPHLDNIIVDFRLVFLKYEKRKNVIIFKILLLEIR